MAKPFKIFLIIVGIFVGLLAIGAIAIAKMLDLDQIKGKVVTSVKEDTGRDLTIGDIELKFFPWLGLTVQDVVLGNAEGFGPEPFAKLANVSVSVRVVPLFHHRVEVSTISVDGLELNLAKDKAGKDNWSDLSKEDKEADEPAESNVEVRDNEPYKVTVGGIEVKDAVFAYSDATTGAAYKVDKLSLGTGPVELGQPLDVTIAFLVTSAQPALESDVKIAFTAIADTENKVFELKDLKAESTTKGATVPGGSQKANLRGGVKFDQGKGVFNFSDGVVEAAGMTLNANVTGEGIGGEAPKLHGKIATNTFNPKQLAKSFGVELPPTADEKALTAASFGADIGGDPNNASLENVTIKLDQTTATGRVSIRNLSAPVIAFALKADSMDADRYLAPQAKSKDEKPSKDGAEDVKKTQIPVDALDSINASGTVALGSLKLKGMSLTDILVTINARKGEPKTEELVAKLYGGKVTQSARLTPGKTPRYDVKMGLDAVNSAPLLKDFLGKAYLSGLGTFNLNFTSTGSTVGDILQAMNGATALNFKEGAVEGFDLYRTIEQARALYKGDVANATAAPTGPARTPFKDLKGAGKIEGGILKTDTLNVGGTGYALAGAGDVNLVNQTLDYTLNVSSDKYKELAGTKVPIKVSGSWFDPSVKLGLGNVVKERAKEEVQKQVEKQEEKLKSKFGDFLNKKFGAPQPNPQPAPAPAPEAKPAEPAPADKPAESPPSQ